MDKAWHTPSYTTVDAKDWAEMKKIKISVRLVLGSSFYCASAEISRFSVL
jgi:hypothetical protein